MSKRENIYYTKAARYTIQRELERIREYLGETQRYFGRNKEIVRKERESE